MKKIWLVWVLFAAAVVALAAACSGTDAPAAFAPSVDAGKSNSAADASRDHPPPRPIDEKPDAAPPDDAPAPQITSIAPDKGILNQPGPTIVVNGALFVPRSKVLIDGAEVATSFESENQLKATIPDDKLKMVAKLKVSVTTAAPGGGTTSDVEFSVENPKPELTALDPLSVNTGAGATILNLTGKNFVPNAKVRFGTTDYTAQFKSDTQISVSLPSSSFAQSGSILVKVTNPLPGGGTSSELAFTIANPTSTITALSPSKGILAGPAFTLTVTGTGFVENSVVLFNGAPVTTTRVASDQLRASIPATGLTSLGNVPVTVQTPPPGGGISTPFVFAVEYPTPTLSTVSPSTIPAGATPTEVTVSGSGFFDQASAITFDGTAAATTYVDATHLKATLTAAQLALAGTIEVKVTNPTPGGGASGARSISVENGIPKINAFQPAGVPANADVTVDILGSGFVTNTTAKARTTPATSTTVPVTYVDSGHLKVQIPASLLTTPGTNVTVTLTNPPPGGGSSSSSSPKLQVLCDTSGPINVHLINTTKVDTLTTDFASADKLPRWAAGGGTCPDVDIFPAEQQPVHWVLVENETTSDMIVTAWGECPAGKGDGFLAVYKGGTQPADDAARKQCSTIVNEGASTPDSNGSNTCPGLLKGAGGLKLAACERAYLQIQAFKFDDTNNPPPVSLKVKGEAP